MNNYSIIGIDFGTSTTVVKVKNYFDGMKGNECQPLMIGNSTVVPTLIFENDQRMYFGREAESEYNNSDGKGTLYRNFKMDLLIPERQEKAKELVRAFMMYLYQQFSMQKAQLNLFNTVKTFISYPAKWTPDIIAFMKQSVIDAGFGTEATVFGETEPTAAIYATFTNHEEALKEHRLVSQGIPLNVMMLDMGAGTSDVTIFRFMADRQNKFHIGLDGKIISHPAVDNAYLCGGREIDRLLSEYNYEYLKSIIPGGNVNEGLWNKISAEIKSWKESHLSPRLQNGLEATMPGQLMTVLNTFRAFLTGPIPQYEDIDREKFQELTKEHWSQLHTLITDAIAKAAEVIPEIRGPEDIDLLIVTGGHSQWYCVKDMCLGRSVAGLAPINFRKIIDDPERLIAEARPQETVANGLVFRDLAFDIRHTSANNLWLQLSLNDKTYSDVYQVLNLFDVLPTTRTVEWKQTIVADSFSLDDAKIICHCCYGADEATGVHTTKEAKATLNSLGDFLFKAVFSPFYIIDRLSGSDGSEKYTVTVNITVQINEDGGARIGGILNCNGNSTDFVMNL